MARNSNRGFASMDREERRRISSMGGRARGEQQSNREDYDDDDYGYESRGRYEDEDYDDDYDNGNYRSQGRYDNDYDDHYEDEEDDYGGRGNRGGRSNGGGRGFASMDRDEVRRIAAMGGHASHGGSQHSGGGRGDYNRGGSSNGGSRPYLIFYDVLPCPWMQIHDCCFLP